MKAGRDSRELPAEEGKAVSAAGVARTVAALSTAFRPHGGGLVLEALEGATVRVRFTGMCTGCPARILCHEQTVVPVLGALSGVHGVEAPGTRVDAAAAARLRQMLGTSAGHDPASGPGSEPERGGEVRTVEQ
jgi:Fe-S cluster biogenesis protein NfuA